MPDTIPFSQLSAALQSLDFEKISTAEFTAFRHSRSDALLVLPREDLFPEVDLLHLGAARDTVFYKGVASLAEFDRLLAEAARVQTKISPFLNGRFVTTKPRPKTVVFRNSSAAQMRKKAKVNNKTTPHERAAVVKKS